MPLTRTIRIRRQKRKNEVKGKIVFFSRPVDEGLLNTFTGYGSAVDQRVYGAVEAEKILSEFSYPKDRIQKVMDCIITHRGSVPMSRLTQEAECIASADAMTHVFRAPSLLHLAYVTHGMGIDEGKEWVMKKIDRSMNKLCPKAKEMVYEHYLKVKEVLV